MSVTRYAGLTPFTTTTLEPVGTSYSSHVRRVLHRRTFSEDERMMREAAEAERRKRGTDLEDPDHVESEDEDPKMLRRDPKDWKTQDHYAVLGLSRLRFRASEEQIRRAHRKKVLVHHPDKKAAASHGGDTNNDAFFKCIAKAFEILSNPEKRRQFDSVDEAIDDEDVPTVKATKQGDFIKLWSPVFERESRFSKVQPVPQLGDSESPKEHVERFYNFYYNFDSWRSFEYLDENDPNEGSDSRDDKRYAEKKNKTQRAQKKKEDSARLRKLVDTALSLDPRIKAFKEQEKAAREAKKKGTAASTTVNGAGKPVPAAAAAAAGPKGRPAKPSPAEAARLAKEAAERERALAAQSAEQKKEKEALKKAVKDHKRKIRSLVKDNNYLLPAAESASPARIERSLDEIDRLIELTANEQLSELRAAMESAFATDGLSGLQRSLAQAIAKTPRPEDFKELSP